MTHNDGLIWRPFTSLCDNRQPLKILKAEGLYLFTEDGRRLADMNASWWVNIHGHGHPYIKQAILRQLENMDHVMFSNCTHDASDLLAFKLKKYLPYEHQKVFFSDNGSTAVEVGLKMALQYFYLKKEKRLRFLAFQGAYHGDTFGSMSVAERNIFSKPFSDLLFQTFFIPLPNKENIHNLLQFIEKEHRIQPFAGFIYEPLVQGAAGMRMYEATYLNQILGKCREWGILCIADEVMTAFGRTGTFLASDQMTHKPDILCLSKGLTGGYMPLGLTSASESVVEVFRSYNPEYTFYHGHSYTAYPIACAAAVANIELFENENTLNKVTNIESWYKKLISDLKSYPNLKNLRFKGGIFATEIHVKDMNDDYLNPLKGKLFDFFLERNILIRPLGNTFYLIPPYCVKEEEIKKSMDVLMEFLSSISP
jgi:adenosylmethionine-8-amino-7-oxononanoate aminotransferase